MDVIAAIATGSAATAIGIVRVSGDGCFALCGRVFRAAGGRPFAAQEPRKMVFGEMLDRAGRVIDRGLAVRFPGPGSYTGEDCAEFHCHGSPVVLRELLSALFAAGARQAQAGEFTKRAFLNGRMDLTQAEAVVDLIDAETAAAARNAAAQLDGGLRRVLEPVQEELLEVTSRFYAVVDYPDEDIQDVRPEEIAAALRSAAGRLERLLELGALPIINENDTISTEEISIGDNDTLSAMVAASIRADLLILLSDIDGLYDSDPHKNPDARLIPVVERLDDHIRALAGGSGSSLGTGGMVTKLQAAQIATEAGCEMVIANGHHPAALYDIAAGQPVGTRFLAGRKDL